MSNFRKVNDDILREWLNYREETELGYLTKEDRKHTINFDEISEKILNSIPKQNRNFVKNILICLIQILQIMLFIGMKNIIEMDFVMVLN